MTAAQESPAAKVMDEAIKLGIEERSPYPERAAFIDADAATVSQQIKSAIDEGYAVVLAFDDGSTRILRGQPAAIQS